MAPESNTRAPSSIGVEVAISSAASISEVAKSQWAPYFPFYTHFLFIYVNVLHSSNHSSNDLLQAVASFEIASNVRKDSCGFIFGVNTFAALFFQTVLTVVVADDIGLALPPRDQVTLASGNSLRKAADR